MKYIDFNKLDDNEFIELLRNLKAVVSIYNDPYVSDYPKMIERIEELLKDDNKYFGAHALKSLMICKEFYKSLSSLYKIDELIDNKNNYSQEQIDEIANNIYLYEENKIRLNLCISKKNSLILNHLDGAHKITSMDKYIECSKFIDDFYDGYKKTENKVGYLKNIYKEEKISVEELENNFNILLDYYTKSLLDTKFTKVYSKYPMKKILDLDNVISRYKFLIKRIEDFLNTNYPIEEEVDYDLNELVTKYSGYKYKEDFFIYLYMQDNIDESKLSNYINYYKIQYLNKYGIKYTNELNILFKAKRIYEEYIEFLDKIERPSIIDKDVLDSYINNNRDIDITFFDLLKKDKVNKCRINNICHDELSEEEITRYSLLNVFIYNRLLTISSNELFKDRIILSDIKNKDMYYNYMINNFFSRKYKPNSRYLMFNKSGLSSNEIKNVNEFISKYTDHYTSLVKENVRTNYVSPREVHETVEPTKEELLSIMEHIMNCNQAYVILEFYKVSPYSVSIFYNLARKYVNVNQKIYLYKFYNIYGDDILIDDIRINTILNKDIMRYNINDTIYEATKEDKEQVLILLGEENMPITNRTFNCRLRKYVMEKLNTNTEDNVLIKK